MLSIVKSMSLHGLEGFLIDVQVDVSAGMPSWQVVGLPDTTVKEANERVKTAIKNSGFEFQSRKIVVNLAPADTKKGGSFFDLPIAVGILISFAEIEPQDLEDTVFIGELSLDGKLNHINGVLPMCIEAKKIGIKRIILPKENEEEASIVEGIKIIGIENLKQVVNYLNNKENIVPKTSNIEEYFEKKNKYNFDFSEVKGQENIKRALEVAAARWSQPSINSVFLGSRKDNDGKENTIYFARYIF
jgi:magnesium chelatase family protein